MERYTCIIPAPNYGFIGRECDFLINKMVCKNIFEYDENNYVRIFIDQCGHECYSAIDHNGQ